MLSSFRLGTALVAGLFIAGAATAQNTPNNRHYLHNGGDVVFIYGDPTVGASAGSGSIDTSGDLFWMVWPNQSMISCTSQTEIMGASFGLFDTDWTDSGQFCDMLFGPGVTDGVTQNITPDFTVGGLSQSTLLNMGGSSGFPNPCTASPGFCTSIGGTSVCPPSGFVVGYFVSVGLSSCDGTGIIWVANNTVDNVITAFLPGGMTFQTGSPGQCGIGNYSLQTEASTDETQLDNSLATGLSRYGGFQVGAAPGLIQDATTERSVYNPEFCDSMVNTTWDGDEGTAGLHVDVVTSTKNLQQVVSDTAGLGAGKICFVSNCILPPFGIPGIPIFGGCVMLNLTDPTTTATLRQGAVATVPDFTGGTYPFTQDQFTPGNVIPVNTGITLTLSSQGYTLDVTTLTGRGSVLTQTNFNM